MSDVIKSRILLIGKTGVGKSSFVNYLLGTNLAETGIGKPITPHIKSYTTTVNQLPIEIFDTKGLEVKTSEKIKQEILQEVKKRNSTTQVLDWFHSIFYCVSMKNARFESFEVQLFEEVKKEISQEVHVILTNCDGISPEKIQNMKAKLRNDLGTNSKIYEVCSVTMKKRNGTLVQPYGKEKIVDDIVNILWEDISRKISVDVAKNTKEGVISLICKTENKMLQELEENASLSTFIDFKNIELNQDKADKMMNKLTDSMEEVLEEGLRFLNKELEPLLEPAVKLHNSYFTMYCIDKETVVEDLCIENMFYLDDELLDDVISKTRLGKILDEIEKVGEDFEISLKNLLTMGKAIGAIVTIKRHLKEIFSSIFSTIRNEIRCKDIENDIYLELIRIGQKKSNSHLQNIKQESASEQYEIGMKYYNNIPKNTWDRTEAEMENDRIAVVWFEKASKQNHIPAILALAECYSIGRVANSVRYGGMYGNNLEEEKAMALHLYEQAANLGSIEGEFQSGCCYLYGLGTMKDWSKAVFHFEKVSKIENSNQGYALYKLGEIYQRGDTNNLFYDPMADVIETDLEKAIDYYIKSAKIGCCFAMSELASIYIDDKLLEEQVISAFESFQKIAVLSDEYYDYRVLAECYEKGIGVEIDLDYAKKLNEKSKKLEEEQKIRIRKEFESD